ncbi:MAG TPA: hypothetical protein P5205_22150 [Candidatus Paceibacterota bacterium]|nr:hypothetical protein [Candidatus Paceibacterota bacterium]
MLITKTDGLHWPKPDLFQANVQLQGHHRDRGGIAYERDIKVLTCDPPTAEEHDINLGLASPEPDRERGFHLAAELLGEIAAWFAESKCVSSAGCKAWALALLLRPQCCPEPTATSLAPQLGITKQAISRRMAELYRLTEGRMRSSAMRGEAVRRERSKIALEYHRRAGHRLRRKQ